MARTSPLDGHSLLFLLLLTDEGSSAFPAYHIPAWSDIETTFFPFPICASIRHYSPKLVQKNAWTGQPVRLPAADRHHRNPTPPGSPGAALIAWSPAKGAVTGRKYHCQLSGGMAIQPCLGLIECQVYTALALKCIAHPWTGS